MLFCCGMLYGSVGVDLLLQTAELRTSGSLTTYRSISEGAGAGEGSYEIGCLGSGSLGLLSLVEDLLVLLLGLHEGVLEVVGVYK